MSDDEEINSNDYSESDSSDSSPDKNTKTKSKNKSQKYNQALSNLKTSLNLQNSEDLDLPNKKEASPEEQKIFYENSAIPEDAKNIKNDDKINFNDVMKLFSTKINETSKANLSKAVKTYMKTKDSDLMEIKFNDKAEKLIEREKNYKDLKKEISEYQNKVKENREADVLDFTQEKNSNHLIRKIQNKTLKEIATQHKEENEFENNIKNLLVKNNCESDDRILQYENEQLLKISPEEIKNRYNQIKGLRALLLQREIANQRKNKIKSKLYHKIKNKQNKKEEDQLLRQLQEIDPEAVQSYIEKKQKDRIQERMNLKHSINSKFNKTIKRYHLDKDQQTKEAIKENYQLRDKLLQKVKGKEDDDDEEEEEENEDQEDDEAEEEEDNNDNKGENDDKKVVIDFKDEENESKEQNEVDKGLANNTKNPGGVFSMKFMQAKSNEETEDYMPKIEKLKKKLNNDEDSFNESYDDSISNSKNKNKNAKQKEDDDSSSSSDEKMDKNKANQINTNINKPTKITSNDLSNLNKDANDILTSNKNLNQSNKLNIQSDELNQIMNEQKLNEEEDEFNNFLIENEDNKKEFLENENKEQIEKIKKENPDYLEGWGSWTGESKELKTKEFLKKKRYESRIQKLMEVTNDNVNNNPFVKVNNAFDKNYSEYLVQQLPNDVASREQFEKLNNMPIGREWNSLTMYKKIIQPKIVKKIGQIIQPMSIHDRTSAMKLTDIIEKATKKKQQTKKKL